jgi:hypothetical protein
MRYGQINFGTFLAAFIYLAGSAMILFLSYQYLIQIDWSIGLTIFQGGVDMFGVNRF